MLLELKSLEQKLHFRTRWSFFEQNYSNFISVLWRSPIFFFFFFFFFFLKIIFLVLFRFHGSVFTAAGFFRRPPSVRKWASFLTRRKKASIPSSRRAAPKTATKWSSGATSPTTDREPTSARPNADGATPRRRGGRGGGGSRRWRLKGGAAASRSAVNRRRCCRGRPA